MKKIGKVAVIVSLVLLSGIILIVLFIQNYQVNDSFFTNDENIIKSILSEINIQNSKLPSSGQNYQDIKNNYKHENIFFSNNSFDVVRFSDNEGGDELIEGGCKFILFHSYIKVNNSLFDTSLNNLYNLMKPGNTEEFMKLIRVSDYFNNTFCGHRTYYTTKSYFYSPFDKKNCTLNDVIDTKAIYDPVSQTFTYYTEVYTVPITLKKNEIKIENNEVSSTAVDKYSCDSGIYL